jgi:threonine dehydrogenase-like Zn-dependent dehydrogenase
MPWVNPAREEKRGLNAVVLGAGPVGLLGALALLVRGFDTWIYSRESASSPRAAWVNKVGARYIESGKLAVGDLAKQVGNVDLIYEATGSAALAFAALPAIGKNGVFIFTGVPGHKTPVTLDAEPIMRDLVLANQLLYGTVNAGPSAFEASIRDLGKFNARWPGPVRELITGHFPPEEITDILSPSHGGIKNVIRFGTPIGATTGTGTAAAPARAGARG